MAMAYGVLRPRCLGESSAYKRCRHPLDFSSWLDPLVGKAASAASAASAAAAAAAMTSPRDPHTKTYTHINGALQDLVDRTAVTELCKGWPLYRDASEWKNYRSLFADEAYVWTTWTGPLAVDDFIAASKAGKKNGVFIMHRECGTLAALGAPAAPHRALGKMKATITHRFLDAPSSAKYDVDCDCRFVFFCEKDTASGDWKTRFVKLFYEKDKVVPVDGRTAPVFTNDELDKYPEGYRFLAAAQARLGYDIDVHLPVASGSLWDDMYGQMEKWLDGQDVHLFWEPKE